MPAPHALGPHPPCTHHPHAAAVQRNALRFMERREAARGQQPHPYIRSMATAGGLPFYVNEVRPRLWHMPLLPAHVLGGSGGGHPW